MVDLQRQEDLLREQRKLEDSLQQGHRNIHQVIALIEVWEIDPAEKELTHGNPRVYEKFKQETKRILLISTTEDVEGTKRDPRWLLLKGRSKPPQVKEKKHIKELESIELTETKGNTLKLTFTFFGSKQHVVYLLAEQRAQLMEVLWWAIQTCQYYFKFLPASNLNKREIDNLTMEWNAYMAQEEIDGADGYPSITPLMSHTQVQILKMLMMDSKEDEKADRERKSTYQVHVKLSSEESKTIEVFLQESGLHVEDIHLLEEYLNNELAEMENKNIQALFGAENRTTTGVIIDKMGEIEGLVHEIATWMARYEDSLDEMRKGVRKIEARNKKLKVQEQNHQRLQNYLARLLSLLRLDNRTTSDLRRPDFRNKLKEMLAAASALQKTMNILLDPGIEHIKAVKERRQSHRTMAKTFTGKAFEFLSEYFNKLAHSRITEIKHSERGGMNPLSAAGGGRGR